MKAFLKAFNTYTQGTAFYTLASGLVYLDSAPSGTVLPYAVWSFPTDRPEDDLDGKVNSNVSGQLDIYAGIEDDLSSLFEQSRVDFHRCSFSFSGGVLVAFRQGQARRIIEDGMKRYIVDYNIEIGEV